MESLKFKGRPAVLKLGRWPSGDLKLSVITELGWTILSESPDLEIVPSGHIYVSFKNSLAREFLEAYSLATPVLVRNTLEGEYMLYRLDEQHMKAYLEAGMENYA